MTVKAAGSPMEASAIIRAVLILCAALSLTACSLAPDRAVEEEKLAVTGALAESTAGWNSGDLDRFMGVYSETPATSFVSEDEVLRGRKKLAERYRTKYEFSDPAKRGALSLQTLDFRLLGPDYALYIGRYTLAYPDGKTVSGPTSLVFAREGGSWRIVADHSS
jgi:uncharacterized protein (TIGR02246 family)